MFRAVGLLCLDTLAVNHAPEVRVADWTPYRSALLEDALLKKYGPLQDADYSLLRKDDRVAVCYHRLPLPSADLLWLTGAYRTTRLSAAFDAALGAMVGAALAVTFDGMTATAIADMLFQGVNDLTFCPFWLPDNILNITGSALSSFRQALPPGGTEVAFGEDLFSVFDGFVYDGRETRHHGPQKGAFLDHPYADVAWEITKAATAPLDNCLLGPAPTLQEVCMRALQGGNNLGPILASMCLQIGLRSGSAGFPKRWCSVVAKPKNSLAFISVIYKVRTSFGLVFVPPHA